MNSKMKAIAIGAITAIAGIGVGAIGTEIASAHANVVSGVSACQADGTYTVTWTIANDYPAAETVSLVTFTGGGTLTGLPVGIAASNSKPYMTATATQSGVPGTATVATLTINGSWADYSQHDGNSVPLAGTCNQVTAGTPTYTEPTCANPTQAAVILATNTPHVGYSTNPNPAVNTAVTTTASANSGWVLTGPSTFPHTFNAAPSNCVTAGTPTYTEPTCANPTQAAVILPTNTPHVTYTTTGTVAPGSTVTTTATATQGFVITGNTVFTHTFNAAPSNCTTLVTPVAPTVVTTTACDVKDTFSTNGPVGIIYTPASGSLNAGQTITVVATAANGYTIKPEAQTTFTLTGGTVETCTTVSAVAVEAPTTPTTQAPLTVAPVPASGLPATGTPSTLILVLGSLLLAAGIGMLSVARRRALK